jgi:hypothetical protein
MRAPTRFYGPAQLGNTTATRYTVPASSLALVRHIHIFDPTGGATVTMSIGADAAGTRIFDGLATVADVPQDHWVYYPLAAAEIIAAHASAASQVVMTISGDLITLG